LKWAKCCSILFSFSPYIFINAYHTITEGLTPFLIVLSIYQFSRFFADHSKRFLIYTGISIGLAILNRPLTGFLLPVFMFAILEKNIFEWKVIRKIVINYTFILIPLAALLTPWTIRNYIVTNGELIPLEKIYYEDPMDFGRGHLYFRRWISCWENPAIVSAEIFSSTLRDNIASGKENDSAITAFINELPPYALQGYTKEDVKKSIVMLNACFIEKYQLKTKDPAIKISELAKLKSEDEVKNSFIQLINKFSYEAPLRYYFITPFKMIGQGIFQSDTIFFGSLNPSAREFNYFQLALKGFMYVLNVCLFLSALFFLFVKKVALALRWMVLAFALFTFISLIYFFNRYLEVRYLLPIYPFLYISLSYFISQLFQKNKSSQTLY